MRMRMLTALLACWLVAGVIASRTALASDLHPTSLTARALDEATGVQEATPEPTPTRPGRIKAPDGQERRTEAEEVAVSGATSDGQAQASHAGAKSSTPAIALVGGAVVIGVAATVFQTRRGKKHERDESDPMQQSLLYHDMDYAAM